VFANLDLIRLGGPTLQQASQDYLGADFIGAHANFSAEYFARTVAKIGFCAAVSALGIAAFTHTPIRKMILGSDPCIGYWVGSWWGGARRRHTRRPSPWGPDQNSDGAREESD